VLKQKAAERNPDEFYFKMNSSKVTEGVHQDIGNDCLDNETVKLMKTQDLGYLIHKTSVDLRKAERLQANLHLIGDKVRRQHKTFVDTKDELETFDVAKHFDTAPEFVNRAFNRPRTETLVTGALLNQSTRKDVKQVAKLTEQSYSELSKRARRVKKLKSAVQALVLQRNLMGSGSKRKVVEGSDGKPPVFKWKRQRQR
jgi:U3 small nucleolar RNA-associated protein 11